MSLEPSRRFPVPLNAPAGTESGSGSDHPDAISPPWREAQSLARMGHFLWDVETGDVSWSQSLYDLFGYDPEVKPDMEWIQDAVHHPEDVGAVRAWLRETAESDADELPAMEYRVVRKDGEVIHVRTTGLVQRDGPGRRVFGTLQDVTEQRRAAEEARGALQELELAVETAGLGIWRLDPASGALAWNDELLTIYGISRREFEEDPEIWTDLLHPEEAQRVEVELGRIAEGEPVFGLEFRIVRPDGEVRHIHASGTPVFDAAGEVVELMGINIDVTEIHRQQAELREREAFLEAIVENSPSAILVADDDGRYRSANPAAAELFGVPVERFGRMSLDDLRSSIGPLTREWYEAFLSEGEQLGELEVTRPDGSRRVARYQAIRIAPDFNLSILSDITRLRRAERESRTIQNLRSLGVMAGGIAHDFNNIMTAVIGNLDLLRSELETGTEARDILEDARSAAQDTRGLAGRLLTFAQGGGPVTRQVALEDVVRDGLQSVVRPEGIAFHYDFPADLPSIELDPDQVSQAATNFATNAVQAMATGGTLEVSARPVGLDGTEGLPVSPGPYILLCFADTGSGMTPDVLGRIFEPYFTTREIGHGLGLSICYSVVEKHGGHILVESEEGEGTTIGVYLPLATGDETERASK